MRSTRSKKGDLSKCDNWRDITILSVPGKVFSIVPLNSPWRAVDACLRDQQAAFRRGRSCPEQIFVLRHVIGPSLEYQQRISLNLYRLRQGLWFSAPRYTMEDSPGLRSSISICRHLSQPLSRLSMLCMDGRNNWFICGWNYRTTRVCAFTNVISPSSTLSPTTPSIAYTLA